MADYIWLRPLVAAEIKFTEWTTGDVLRRAEFVELRDDKLPKKFLATKKFTPSRMLLYFCNPILNLCLLG